MNGWTLICYGTHSLDWDNKYEWGNILVGLLTHINKFYRFKAIILIVVDETQLL